MKEKGNSEHLPYEWEIGMIEVVSQKHGEGDGIITRWYQETKVSVGGEK